MAATRRLYLAYGSNLHRGQMARRCPTATILGISEIPDYTLTFRGSGVATIEPKKGDSVPVLVWSITKRDEQSLDIYEGSPRLYVKQDFTIVLNGEKIKAMAYVMTPGRPLAVPPSSYYNTILTGYKEFGFDLSYLSKCAKACSPKEKVLRFFEGQKAGRNTETCPRCGCPDMIDGLSRNCLSRFADVYICRDCGTEEAIMQMVGEINDFGDWYSANI